jgi:hypothetical protein
MPILIQQVSLVIHFGLHGCSPSQIAFQEGLNKNSVFPFQFHMSLWVKIPFVELPPFPLDLYDGFYCDFKTNQEFLFVLFTSPPVLDFPSGVILGLFDCLFGQELS